MVFPLYVTLERMDRTLVEASKDLGAGRWATFRQITLPIALPGPDHRQHPRVHPDDGRVRHPGDPRLRAGVPDRQRARARDFLEARNWPSGSARAVVLILIMLVTITFYLWFANRGRQTRDVSVL